MTRTSSARAIAVVAVMSTGCGGADNPPAPAKSSTGGSAGSEAGATGGSRGQDGSTDAGGAANDSGHAPDATPSWFSQIGPVVAIKSDFLFTEGPVWDPKKQVLYFTDTNADTIYQFTPPDTFDVLLKPSGYPDGLALDPDGHIIVAGYVHRDVWRLSPGGGKPGDGGTRGDAGTVRDGGTPGDGGTLRGGGTMTSLASNYQGQKLNTPDDLIARSDGVIYFTDPTFGLAASTWPAGTAELSFQGVYRITTDGVLHLEDQTTPAPNGVNLSPDEHTLYVSYTGTGEIAAFTVAADGSLSDRRVFATGVTVADSMCVDSEGNLYVASFNGITVIDTSGTKLGVIPVGQVPTNASFGGSDQRTLFITARKGLVGVPTAGNSALFKIENMPIPGLPGRP